MGGVVHVAARPPYMRRKCESQAVVPVGWAQSSAFLLLDNGTAGQGLVRALALQGPAEMDSVTWAALQRHFGPLRGFDVTAAPHPVPELHGR